MTALIEKANDLIDRATRLPTGKTYREKPEDEERSEAEEEPARQTKSSLNRGETLSAPPPLPEAIPQQTERENGKQQRQTSYNTSRGNDKNQREEEDHIQDLERVIASYEINQPSNREGQNWIEELDQVINAPQLNVPELTISTPRESAEEPDFEVMTGRTRDPPQQPLKWNQVGTNETPLVTPTRKRHSSTHTPPRKKSRMRDEPSETAGGEDTLSIPDTNTRLQLIARDADQREKDLQMVKQNVNELKELMEKIAQQLPHKEMSAQGQTWSMSTREAKDSELLQPPPPCAANSNEKHDTIRPPGKGEDYVCDGFTVTELQFLQKTKNVMRGHPKASEIAKYNYLLNYSKNHVHALIASYADDPEPFTGAWQALAERVKDVDPFEILMTETWNIRDASSEETLAKLVKLFTNLEQVNRPEQDRGMLARAAFKSLEIPVQARFRELNPTSTSNTFLNLQRNRQALQAFILNIMRERARTKQETRNVIYKPTARRSQDYGEDKRRVIVDTTPRCQLCKGKHWPARCPEFRLQDQETRRKLVANAGACFVCLEGGHQASQCRAPRCRECSRAHHTLLHTDKARVIATVVSEAARSSGITAMLVKATSEKTEEAVLLLDSGAGVSLIAADFAEKIKARCLKEEVTTFITVTASRTLHTKRVEIWLGEKKVLQALIYDNMPKISQRALEEDEYETFPHLQGYNIPTLKNRQIDILIGLDHPTYVIPRGQYSEEKKPTQSQYKRCLDGQ